MGVYTRVPISFPETFAPPLLPRPPWIKSDLKEAKGTTAGAVVNEVQMLCLEAASLVGSSFPFSAWFLPSPFWPAFGCSNPLNGKRKTLQYSSAASPTGSSLSRRRSDISVPRTENPQRLLPKECLLMHACASWCLSGGKMLNGQQNSSLRLVVVWSKSRSRGQRQHFIWLRGMYFCKEFPICQICGWSEDRNRRVLGRNSKVDTRGQDPKIQEHKE